MVEVGGFEPPSLVLDQVDRLTPPVSCYAARSRLRSLVWIVTKAWALSTKKSPPGENLEGRALEVQTVKAVAKANDCPCYACNYAEYKNLFVG